MKITQTITQALALSALLIISLAVMSTPTAAQNATVYNWVLVNNTRSNITEVHVVRNGASNWGKDILDLRDGSLDSGESFTLHVPLGEYDVKLVKQNGDACSTRRVTVTKPLTWRITNEWLQGCVARSGN
jgi:hypothetical protein